MKKLIALLVLITIVFGIYSEDQFLWCKRLFVNEPSTHVIEKGEYFSKLSQKYYGAAKYWRELALINRAPNSDLVFPGEKIIVPSIDAIRKIRRSRSLSSVNEIVKDQENWLAERRVTPNAELAANLKKDSFEKQVAANKETYQAGYPGMFLYLLLLVFQKNPFSSWQLILHLV